MLSIIILIIAIFSLLITQKFYQQKWLTTSTIVLVNILIVELICYFILLFIAANGGNFALIGNQKILDALMRNHIIEAHQKSATDPYSLYQTDPYLGYSVGRDKYTYQHKSLNNSGMRADKDYSLNPPANKLRIVALGDSYVFCDDELTQNCWTYYLEKNIGNLEVLNFGVSGYGLGQSYLRFLKEGLAFQPDVILLNYTELTNRDKINAEEIIKANKLTYAYLYRVNFWVENNLLKSRAVTILDLFNKQLREAIIYQPLHLSLKDMFLFNPFFSVSNTALLVKQALLPSYLSSRLKKDSANPNDKIINFKILEDLLNTAKLTNAIIVFTNIHNPKELPQEIQVLFSKYSKNVITYKADEVMKKLLTSAHIEYKSILNKSNHYDAKGNLFYARAIGILLESRQWGASNRRFVFDRASNGFIRN